MAQVGPGAQREHTENPQPALAGASEFEWVEILNPLTDDFVVRVAQEVPVNLPLQIRAATAGVQSEGDVLRNYGLNLKNPDHKGKKYIHNDTVIPAGQSRRFKGSDAQVAVDQLIKEILQREGKTRLMADPVLRRSVEDTVIMGRGSINDLMQDQMQTPRQQADAAIKQANEVVDVPFPGLSQATESDADGSGNASPNNKPSPKPAKSPSK